MSLTTRNDKGSPLTFSEMDNNLLYLESEAKNKLWEEDGSDKIKPMDNKTIDSIYIDNLPEISYDRVLFVSKEGDDSNDGKTEFNSLLTITRALELSNTRFLIKILDNGIYEENLIIGEEIVIDAPNAVLKGTVIVGDCSYINFNIISASSSNQTLIQNIGCTGNTIIKANRIESSGLDSDNFVENVIFQNLTSDGDLLLESKLINVCPFGHFIFSINTGGDDERTASSNNWSGTGDVVNPNNVWVNSTLSALATWGSSDGPRIEFLDDPNDENSQSLQYTFSVPAVINKINIFQHATWMVNSSPNEFKIYARQSGETTWDELFYHVGGLNFEDNEFNFTNNTAYIAYKLVWLGSTNSNNFVRISRVSLFNSNTEVGGKIKFNVGKINHNEGSLCILAESETCDYSGYINEAIGENASFLEMNNGRIAISSNKINFENLYKISNGKAFLNVLDYEGSTDKTGGDLIIPNFNIL